MKHFTLGLGILVISAYVGVCFADHALDGTWSPPREGQVCKLVCETKKLTAIGYGYECDTICVPAASRRGCKHCDTNCCSEDELDGCPPRVEFCWYDWFACGCAKPRTVRVLTKYEAEKEVSWYHWEVVDAACCDCDTQSGRTGQPRDVYKPAPDDAQLGDILAVTDEEWAALASIAGTDVSNADRVARQAEAAPTNDSAEGRSDPAFIRLGRILAAPFSK